MPVGQRKAMDKNIYASFLLRYQPSVATTLPLISPYALDIRARRDPCRCSADELGKAFASDPSLSARLIGDANSIFFNRRHGAVYTLSEAFNTVGIEHAFKVLSDAYIFRKRSEAMDRQIREMWIRWMASAFATRALSTYSQATALSSDAIFVVGLIHNIGHLLELHYDPRRLANITKHQDNELEGGDRSHSALGEALTRAWSLPDCICNAIRWHHIPQNCPSPAARILAALLFLGDHLAASYLTDNDIDISTCSAAMSIAGVQEQHLLIVDGIIRKEPCIQIEWRAQSAYNNRFINLTT